MLDPLWWSVSWTWSVLVAVLAVLAVCFYRHVNAVLTFWPSRGVTGPAPMYPFGMVARDPATNERLSGMFDIDHWLYYHHGGKGAYCGYLELTRPVLFLGNLNMIRSVLVKDFDYFIDRRTVLFSDNHKRMLTVLKGAEWKETRSVLTPTFSSSKMRAMHDLTLRNGDNMVKYLVQQAHQADEVDMKDVFGRFTMDNIASVAFGVDCDSFLDPNAKFARHASTLFTPFRGFYLFRIMAILMFPRLALKLLPDPARAANKFFRDVIAHVVAERASSRHQQRRDFLQLMLDTVDKQGRRVLDDELVFSQALLFFFAGFDTTSNLLSFASYCLATNPECQLQAQRELDAVLQTADGRLSYDVVSQLSYLDRVLLETLRLYPVASRLERECTRDYTLPGTQLTIRSGQLVSVSLFAIQRDPDLYPDPLRFDPDRFLPERVSERHPCAFLPFGDGPRSCIARRFALYEARAALALLLKDFSLRPGPSTPAAPLPLDKAAVINSPQGGKLLLQIQPRNSTV